ncbi:MAG: hypothetical protein HY904_11560, partial [Deltaproteobacteria bacterium]|nr:hypothetical protein [Deltaproteobacteria bacterium]
LAVGRPGGRFRDVSLGRGGLLELAFVEHAVTNSGTSQPDLLIHETGPDVEGVYVALQPADAQTASAIGFRCRDERKPAGDGFCEIGRTGGGTTGLDIDAVFPGFQKGSLRFNAVQLIDDPEQGDPRAGSLGADIDGVTALFPGAAPRTAWPTLSPANGSALPLPAVAPLSLPAMNIPVVHVGTPAVPRVGAPQPPRTGVVPRPKQ